MRDSSLYSADTSGHLLILFYVRFSIRHNLIVNNPEVNSS